MSFPSALTAGGALLGSAAIGLAGAQPLDTTAAAAPATPAAVTESGAPDQVVEPAQQADPTVVAHRGASGYAPENTLAASDAAAELSVDWVEFDVQRAADGELVVVHDTDLERTTDAPEVFPDRAPWELSDFTYDEIAQLDAGSWFDGSFAGERVPTLGELLERLDEHEQKLLLELKEPALYPGIEAEILEELADHDWLAPERVEDSLVVQSFDEDSVRTVHDLNPDVTTGFLGTPDVAELADYAAFADQVNPPHADVTADYLTAVRELDGPDGETLQVFTWTVNDPEDAQRVADLGVDGIISDYPDVIRDTISS